ncbi:MAG: flagellar hook-associated protein FlgK [Planctomycetota bacterium]|nr:flagellar hook-associated protein FlgK [Planctomycetota bacterium]
MSNFDIGLSGLTTAQKALDVIGNNIANAATEGYHRQRIELTPAYASQSSTVMTGGGVDVAGVKRMIDTLLEDEILRQQSSQAQVSQELTTMKTVESAFGELSTESGGLNAAIDNFFNAMQDLSAHSGESIWQNKASTAADAMASQFRTLGVFLTTMELQIQSEAENNVEQSNTLITQIAELNGNIERMEIGGSQASNLRDQRDQCVTELSKLIGVQTVSREYGMVDVVAGGIPVVTGTSTTKLEVGLNEDGKIGVGMAGTYTYNTDLQGGQLGGLLSLKNELVSNVHNDLNDLASSLIQQVNQYHIQGVGSQGSFDELTGGVMTSQSLVDFEPPVTDGKIYIRVTNTGTGEISREEIDVDASTDTLSTLAAKISGVTGLTASVDSSKLHIQADTNYKFDFLPAVLPSPSAQNLTGTSVPAVSVSGVYTGTENQTFQFTAIGTGLVGNGSLQLEVKNGAGEVVTTFNIGSGYAAGDKLDLGNGIKVTIGTGDLNYGDTFDVDAFGSTDTSGVLAAAEINTIFSGSDASTITVASDIADNPARIATALGSDMTDNTNILRLAALKDQNMSDLKDRTLGDFYRQIVTDIGQDISIKQTKQDNVQAMVQNLSNQQSQISGVNVNDEAAQMMVFQQMFQAMAKYINTIQTSMSSLMDLL